MENKTEIKSKKRSQDSNRLTLSDQARENSKKWVEQINTEFKGMLKLQRNEVLNFVLEQIGPSLSIELLKKLRSDKLTGSHLTKWIHQKTIEAEKNGVKVDVEKLFKEAQGAIKRPRKPRTKKTGSTLKDVTNAV